MPIRLAAFDLDGTLIRDRTCVEAINSSIGRTEEAAAFERLDVRDRDGMTAARITMAGWYRPIPTEVLLHDVRGLALAPGTEEAFGFLRTHHVSTAIVSLTLKAAVDWFAERLGADFAVGTHITGEEIDHVWAEDKGRWLQAAAAKLGLHHQEVAAVGDSDGDREMLAAAGFRVFVGDRAPDTPDILHMPGANMYDVAQRILEEP
ncbi:MAG: phosphoserine phosphatase [Actinomycetota bacterium]|nr:phosphoserine phosphatase [Actinomycetota bacterium]